MAGSVHNHHQSDHATRIWELRPPRYGLKETLKRWDPVVFFRAYNDVVSSHSARLAAHMFASFLYQILGFIYQFWHDGCTKESYSFGHLHDYHLYDLCKVPYDRFKRDFADRIARHLLIDTPIGKQNFIEQFKPTRPEIESILDDWGQRRWGRVDNLDRVTVGSAYLTCIDSLLMYLGVLTISDHEWLPWSESEMQQMTNWSDVAPWMPYGNGAPPPMQKAVAEEAEQLAWVIKLGLYARPYVQPCKAAERGIQFMWRLCGGRERFEALVHNTLVGGRDIPLPPSTAQLEPMPVRSQINAETGLLLNERPEVGGVRQRLAYAHRSIGERPWASLHYPPWYQALLRLEEEEKRRQELNQFGLANLRGYNVPADLVDIIRQYNLS